MSSDVMIRVEGLSKAYRVRRPEQRARYRTLQEEIVAAPGKLASAVRGRRTRSEDERFWALQNISLEVKRGEVLGIIGRNGAGKSTLLKILSRITEPTAGRAELYGRAGTLLEVGTGFHAELTGRENIYLSGTILGMRKREVTSRFDDIVGFAGVERFVDTPVKHFSSGMYMRLAFSVAAHLDPEILVVDEVLAVGDAEFQRRCLGKMNDVARSGRTVLFVSHNAGAVRALCTRCMWLSGGRTRLMGPPDSVMSAYLDHGETTGATRTVQRSQRRLGGQAARIEEVQVRDEEGHERESFLIGEPFIVRMKYRTEAPLHGSFWLLLETPEGTVLLSSFQRDCSLPVYLHGDGRVGVRMHDLSLMPGRYVVSAGIFDSHEQVIEWVDHALDITVEPHFSDGRPYDHRLGIITQPMTWTMEPAR